MVGVAQLVRVPDCGSEGRGFESHLPPRQEEVRESLFFCWVSAICGKMCTFAPPIEGHGKDNGNRSRTQTQRHRRHRPFADHRKRADDGGVAQARRLRAELCEARGGGANRHR